MHRNLKFLKDLKCSGKRGINAKNNELRAKNMEHTSLIDKLLT